MLFSVFITASDMEKHGPACSFQALAGNILPLEYTFAVFWNILALYAYNKHSWSAGTELSTSTG